MASQNNSGRQYNKLHAISIIATAALVANRFAGYDGAHATSAGGAHDSQGITESSADIGEAVSVITNYSGVVEASEAITQFAYVKAATDGTGRAALGTATDYCGRALGAATAAGQFLEVQPLAVRHA